MPSEDTAAREQAQRVKAIIERVEVFKRLSMGEAQRLLKLCSYQAYGANEMVYRVGDASEEMLILLQGKLQVLTEDGTVLGEILPGSVTGEMGILTGEPRSATILAAEAASGRPGVAMPSGHRGHQGSFGSAGSDMPGEGPEPSS